MSNQELLYLICLEQVHEGGWSKYYSYYILTPYPPPPSLKKKMNVNSFSKNSVALVLLYMLIKLSNANTI